MTRRTRLEIASATDPGVVRTFNEDSIAIEPDIGLLMLADGMGGHNGGNVASAMATSLIVEHLKNKLDSHNPEQIRTSSPRTQVTQAISEALETSNKDIFRIAQQDEKFQGMGTTIVLMVFHETGATITHLGDSRLYRWRMGLFELLTYDHSLLQEQVTQGVISTVDARYSHNRNLVTRALGVEAGINFDIREVDVLPGDIFLLCSDGLNDMVDDTNIEMAVRELQGNLPLMVNQLVLMANDNGGHDNISVIVAKVVGEPTGTSLISRWVNWLKKTRSEVWQSWW